LILIVSVNSIVILSTPHPHPAVGGKPYSKAVT
jgi:isochorismate synthase EntC